MGEVIPRHEVLQPPAIPPQAVRPVWFKDTGTLLGVAGLYATLILSYVGFKLAVSTLPLLFTIIFIALLLPLIALVCIKASQEVRYLRYVSKDYLDRYEQSLLAEGTGVELARLKRVVADLQEALDSAQRAVSSLNVLVTADGILLWELARSASSGTHNNSEAVYTILDDFLSSCVRFLQEYITINGACILLPNRETGLFAFIACYGLSRRIRERKDWLYFGDNPQMKRCTAADAYRRGTFEIVTFDEHGVVDSPASETYSGHYVDEGDPFGPPHWASHPAASGPPYRAYIALASPMTNSGTHSLAVLCFDSMDHDAFYDPQLIDLLQGLSSRIGSVISSIPGSQTPVS